MNRLKKMALEYFEVFMDNFTFSATWLIKYRITVNAQSSSGTLPFLATGITCDLRNPRCYWDARVVLLLVCLLFHRSWVSGQTSGSRVLLSKHNMGSSTRFSGQHKQWWRQMKILRDCLYSMSWEFDLQQDRHLCNQDTMTVQSLDRSMPWRKVWSWKQCLYVDQPCPSSHPKILLFREAWL